jgi:hypothetical protein
VLAFTTIHEKPFLLSDYCGIGSLPGVASVAHINDGLSSCAGPTSAVINMDGHLTIFRLCTVYGHATSALHCGYARVSVGKNVSSVKTESQHELAA